MRQIQNQENRRDQNQPTQLTAQNQSSRLIAQANKRLKDGCFGLSLLQRGYRMYIRGQLPPKPGLPHTKPHQQEIATGFYANPAGVKQAEKLARLISVEVAYGTFNWKKYARREFAGERRTNADWIAVRKEEYMKEEWTTKKEANWKHGPWEYLRRLSQDAEPNAAEIIRVIKATKPKTRSRRGICSEMKTLVD